MEDQHFWDELAKRLRQEQPQSFQEEDWAAMHGRLRLQRKRRSAGAWLWPAAAVCFFLINNLVWWQLWQKREAPDILPQTRKDTVFQIRERILRDTVWQYVSAAPSVYSPLSVVQKGISEANNREVNNETEEKSITHSENEAGAVPVAAIFPQKTAGFRSSEILNPLTNRAQLIVSPPRFLPAPEIFTLAPVPVRDPALFVEADAGYGRFAASAAFIRQYGASLSVLPASWGVSVGIRAWHAAENPDQAPAKLGLPDDCENCPAAGYPDRVRLQWLEFQFGPVYRLPWLNGRTKLYAAALGHLRGRVDQYRHFYFEQYGPSPPIEVEDRFREEPGLYWNGLSGKLSATHRLTNRLALYGALEGRWPVGVNPRVAPPSAGLNLGLAWYFRD